MKACNKCGIEKELTEFNKYNRPDCTHQAYCRECHNKHIRDYKRKPEPERLTRWVLPDAIIDGRRYIEWFEIEKKWHLERGSLTKVVKKNGKQALYKG
jgi:hypothetical protein